MVNNLKQIELYLLELYLPKNLSYDYSTFNLNLYKKKDFSSKEYMANPFIVQDNNYVILLQSLSIYRFSHKNMTYRSS